MLKNVNAECHPATDIDTVLVRWLDRGQKIISSKANFTWLRQYGYTFATVADTETYSLSPLVDTSKIIHIYDKTTPQYVQNMNDNEFRMYEPGPESTGTPYLYRLIGFSPVLNQPTAASILTMASSSTADTSINVNVQGLNTSGVFVTEAVTLNGTGSVTTTNSYTRVLSLSKSSKTTGTVTITSDAAAVTNVAIAPSDRSVNHPLIGLYTIPSAAITMYYDFTMAVQTLSANDDISLIPEKYHDAIELYAIFRTYKHMNNTSMAQITAQEFTARVDDIIRDDKQPAANWSLNSVDQNATPQIARLSTYFPRGD